MNRIRVGATALGLTLLVAASVAQAQEVTGRVTGRVTDKDTGMPMGGVTVIMQGPQGEDATLTDDRGEYRFVSLTVGTYVIRFYAANTSAEVEQPDVLVQADRMVRVNARIASAVQAAAQQTYVITGKAPVIDVGSARVGAAFDQDFMQNVPLGRTYGDVIERAPGAFFDPSGNVSIGGATGLENIYLLNGMNVTGIEYGNLEAGVPTVGGGTNLPLEFLTQLDVNSGGYQAEFGGAMGGVINTVLKSGSNEFHGSAFIGLVALLDGRQPEPGHPARPLARLRAEARLRHQHRRRGGRSHRQEQALLLARLRPPLHRHPRPPADLRAAGQERGRRGRHRQPAAGRS